MEHKKQREDKESGRLGGFIGELAKYILEMIYPDSCVFCRGPVERDSPEEHICKECLANVSPRKFDESLKSPEGGERFAVRGLGVYDYEDIRESIFRFKYDGFTGYGRIFGEMMAGFVKGNGLRAILGADLIVPVPMWKEKERKRGFNQAALMAESFSELTGIPYCDSAIERIRETAPQMSLSGRDRSANISSAFKVTGKISVAGKRVLLLDDIYTTGSTVRECAKEFFAAGAREVMYIAIASADRGDG